MSINKLNKHETDSSKENIVNETEGSIFTNEINTESDITNIKVNGFNHISNNRYSFFSCSFVFDH